jgi:hypothetical protein
VKYKAVILNFDRGSVEYVAPQDVPKPKKARTAMTGSAPPPAKPQR